MKNVLFLGFILAILFGGYYVYTQQPQNISDKEELQDSPTVNTYHSQEFPYNFNYPANLTVQEYLPTTVAIGSNEGDMFTALVEVQEILADSEGSYTNFDDFVYQTVRNYCAADGPSETIFCDDVESSQLFTSESGLRGEMFSLRRVHKNLSTGVEDSESYGPIYAFNISANNPTVQYAALIVRPGAALPSAEIIPDDVAEVANSLIIPKVETRPTNLGNTVPTDGLITLKIGEVVTENGLTIQLDSVVSDSRCPEGVQCIQAGYVTVELTLSDETREVTQKLNSINDSIHFSGKEISITSVTPAPVAGTPVSKNDYAVTFAVK